MNRNERKIRQRFREDCKKFKPNYVPSDYDYLKFKVCNICFNFFSRKKLTYRCDSCRYKKRKHNERIAHLNKMKLKYKKQCKKLYGENYIPSDDEYLFHKFCKKCNSIKNLKCFSFKRANMCLNCSNKSRRLSQKKFHENNPDASSIYRRKTYLKNKKKILEKQRKDRKKPENLVKERERKRKYRMRRPDPRKTNICLRLHHSISVIIRSAIKKDRESIKHKLDYTIYELKKHLEAQFEPWMSWDNWGIYDPSTWTWQIDHIIPRSNLQYKTMDDENFKKCWALDNLRPLNSKVNIMDGVNRRRH